MLLSTTATKIAKSYNSAQFKRSLFISTFKLNLVELVLKEINKKRRLKTHKVISCDTKKNALNSELTTKFQTLLATNGNPFNSSEKFNKLTRIGP